MGDVLPLAVAVPTSRGASRPPPSGPRRRRDAARLLRRWARAGRWPIAARWPALGRVVRVPARSRTASRRRTPPAGRQRKPPSRYRPPSMIRVTTLPSAAVSREKRKQVKHPRVAAPALLRRAAGPATSIGTAEAAATRTLDEGPVSAGTAAIRSQPDRVNCRPSRPGTGPANSTGAMGSAWAVKGATEGTADGASVSAVSFRRRRWS